MIPAVIAEAARRIDLTAPRRWLRRLGPGLVTGAADDDPSGIATYSQAGAQFGLNMLWTPLFTLPLMVAIQLICARIGRVTGHGLARNLTAVFPRPVVYALVGLLFIANTLNIGADLAAMGAAARLVLGGGGPALTLTFAGLSLGLLVFVPYHRYVRVLKWLTMALFAYVAVVFTVRIDWAQVAIRALAPHLSADAWTVVVAVFGTTISPYLFFWQTSEEVEEEEVTGQGALLDHPAVAAAEFRRIEWDTLVGMGLSNLVAFFIILTTAVTLHQAGFTEIRTAEEAATALKPVAGPFAALLFSLGVIGTGLLAVPVLAVSFGYAIGELRGWTCGLERRPAEAPKFYAVIAAAVVLGLVLQGARVDPIAALFWSAVVNGVISAPLMAATLIVSRRRAQLGPFVATPAQALLGWIATAAMTAAVAAMLWGWRR
jgi:NRAMP (natural resistance-associated macrophage protein)-like metal ion transporter